MSTTIDEKIVEMQFDNTDFKSKTKSTIELLEKFKASLSFSSEEKNVDSLQKTVSKFDTTPMAKGIEAIQQKFSTMSIAGITAIQNLTNRMVDFAIQTTKAFTITPVFTGFQEYETKIGSIQTILTNTASKGTTIDDVTKSLDVLNEYADKTIYNFAEMTRNIGTFTAAGIGLEDASTAIKGIANLGAGSGSTPAQVATAMYQMSQAMSAGRLMLQDYNSLTNAGMGGELFKQMAIDVAKSRGLIDEAFDISQFRYSLEDGWLTSDVLLEVFQNFADDPALVAAATELKTFTALMGALKESVQSGWAKSFEYIIGDFDGAKNLFTEINDVIGSFINSTSEARNVTLAAWNSLGGRTSLLTNIKNIFESLLSVINPITSAFNEIFPKKRAVDIVNITKSIESITASFKLTTLEGSLLNATFKNIFTGVSSVIKVIKSVISAFITAGSSIGITRLEIIEALYALSGLLVASSDLEINLTSLTNVVKTLLTPLTFLINAIKNIGASFNVDSIISGITFLKDTIGVLFKDMSLIDVFIGGSIIAGGSSLYTLIVNNIIEPISNAFETLSSLFGKGGESSLSSKIFMMAGAIGAFAGSLLLLSSINDDKILTSLGLMISIFGTLIYSMTAISAIPSAGIIKNSLAIGMLSQAMLGLSASLWILSKINLDQIPNVAVMLAIIIGSISALNAVVSSINTVKIAGLGLSLIPLSLGLLSFGGAIAMLSKISVESILSGIIKMVAVIGSISLISTHINPASLIKISATMSLLAVAITALIVPIALLNTMSIEGLIKGVGAILILVGGLSLINNFLGSLSNAASILILATALNALIIPLSIISNMSISSIAKGVLGLAGALFIIGGVSSLMSPLSVGIVAFSSALLLLGVSISTIGVGLTLLSAGFAALAVSTAVNVASITGTFTALFIGLSLAIENAAPMIVRSIGNLAINLVNVLGLLGIKVIDTVLSLLTTLLITINTKLPEILPLITSILLTVADNLAPLISVFVALAVMFIVGFMNGLSSKAPELISSAVSLIRSLIQALSDTLREDSVIAGLVEDGIDLASAVIEGMVQGLFAGLSSIKDAVKNVASTIINEGKELLDINSPSGESYREIGVEINPGISTGIDDTTDVIKQSLEKEMNSVFDPFFSDIMNKSKEAGSTANSNLDINARRTDSTYQDSLYNRTHTSTLPKTEELPVSTAYEPSYTSGYSGGTSSDPIVERFSEASEAINHQVRYFNMSVADQIAAWELLEKEFEKGSLQQLQTEEKINELKFNNSSSWIDKQIKYNAFGLKEQIEAWQRVEKQYEKGSKNQVAAEEKVYDLRYQMLEEYTEKVKSLEEEYNTKLADRTSEIANSFELFEAPQESEVLSGTELISNLENQTDAIRTFYDNLEELSEKGVNEKLVQQLRDSGIDMSDQVAAIARMSSRHIDELNEAYSDNQITAELIAVEELKEDRLAVEEELTSMINDLEVVFADEGFTAGRALPQGLADGIEYDASQAIAAAITLAKEALEAARAELGINSPSDETFSDGQNYDLGLINGMMSMLSNIKMAGSQVGKTALASIRDTMSKIGSDIDSSLEYNPTIKPVLDLTGITKMSNHIPKTLGVSTSLLAAQHAVSDTYYPESSKETNIVNEYSFTQNNTSPKALNRFEIFRQTNTQFALFKEVVEKA